MDKWQRKIVRAIYKTWINKNYKVSVEDVAIWLQDKNNWWSISQEILNNFDKSWWFKIYYFFDLIKDKIKKLGLREGSQTS